MAAEDGDGSGVGAGIRLRRDAADFRDQVDSLIRSSQRFLVNLDVIHDRVALERVQIKALEDAMRGSGAGSRSGTNTAADIERLHRLGVVQDPARQAAHANAVSEAYASMARGAERAAAATERVATATTRTVRTLGGDWRTPQEADRIAMAAQGYSPEQIERMRIRGAYPNLETDIRPPIRTRSEVPAGAPWFSSLGGPGPLTDAATKWEAQRAAYLASQEQAQTAFGVAAAAATAGTPQGLMNKRAAQWEREMRALTGYRNYVPPPEGGVALPIEFLSPEDREKVSLGQFPLVNKFGKTISTGEYTTGLQADTIAGRAPYEGAGVLLTQAEALERMAAAKLEIGDLDRVRTLRGPALVAAYQKESENLKSLNEQLGHQQRVLEQARKFPQAGLPVAALEERYNESYMATARSARNLEMLKWQGTLTGTTLGPAAAGFGRLGAFGTGFGAALGGHIGGIPGAIIGGLAGGGGVFSAAGIGALTAALAVKAYDMGRESFQQRAEWLQEAEPISRAHGGSAVRDVDRAIAVARASRNLYRPMEIMHAAHIIGTDVEGVGGSMLSAYRQGISLEEAANQTVAMRSLNNVWDNDIAARITAQYATTRFARRHGDTHGGSHAGPNVTHGPLSTAAGFFGGGDMSAGGGAGRSWAPAPVVSAADAAWWTGPRGAIPGPPPPVDAREAFFDRPITEHIRTARAFAGVSGQAGGGAEGLDYTRARYLFQAVQATGQALNSPFARGNMVGLSAQIATLADRGTGLGLDRNSAENFMTAGAVVASVSNLISSNPARGGVLDEIRMMSVMRMAQNPEMVGAIKRQYDGLDITRPSGAMVLIERAAAIGQQAAAGQFGKDNALMRSIPQQIYGDLIGAMGGKENAFLSLVTQGRSPTEAYEMLKMGGGIFSATAVAGRDKGAGDAVDLATIMTENNKLLAELNTSLNKDLPAKMYEAGTALAPIGQAIADGWAGMQAGVVNALQTLLGAEVGTPPNVH